MRNPRPSSQLERGNERRMNGEASQALQEPTGPAALARWRGSHPDLCRLIHLPVEGRSRRQAGKRLDASLETDLDLCPELSAQLIGELLERPGEADEIVLETLGHPPFALAKHHGVNCSFRHRRFSPYATVYRTTSRAGLERPTRLTHTHSRHSERG